MSRRRKYREEDRVLDIVKGIGGLVMLVGLLRIVQPQLFAEILQFVFVIGGVVLLVVAGAVIYMIVRQRRARNAIQAGPIRVSDLQTLSTSGVESEPLIPTTVFVEPANPFRYQPDSPPSARPHAPAARAFAPRNSASFVPISQEDLRTIDWFQFEKLMGVLYESRGGRVERRGGANPDGGIDLVIYENSHRVAVQCKHWRIWKVGVRHFREFFGGMKAEGFDHGIFVTLEGCTNEARAFADAHSIAVLDSAGVQSMLSRADRGAVERIRSIIDDPTKHCPKCGAAMEMRTAERGPNPGSQFWGCSRYPRCHGKMRLTD